MLKKALTLSYILLLSASTLLLSCFEFASANPHSYYLKVPPKVTLLSPLADQTYSQSDISINVQVQMQGYSLPYREHLRSIKYSLDEQPAVSLTITEDHQFGDYEGSGTGTLSKIAKGPHELVINVETELTDHTNFNNAQVVVYFIVESVEAHIRVSSPQPKTYSEITVPLAFLGDKGLTWAGYSLDHNPIVTCQDMLTNLSNGNHALRIYGKDPAGKLHASETVVFSINGKKPPTVTLDIDAILNARIYLPSDFQNRTYWKLYFHVSEPVPWMAYSIDEGDNQTVDGNMILRMTYGKHTIIVYAKDYCGNSGASAPYTFTLAPNEAGSAYASQTPKPSKPPSNWTAPSNNPAHSTPNSTVHQQTPQDAFPTALVATVTALTSFVLVTSVFLLKRTPMKNKR